MSPLLQVAAAAPQGGAVSVSSVLSLLAAVGTVIGWLVVAYWRLQEQSRERERAALTEVEKERRQQMESRLTAAESRLTITEGRSRELETKQHATDVLIATQSTTLTHMRERIDEIFNLLTRSPSQVDDPAPPPRLPSRR